jgi:hypothetical protein
MFSLDEIYERMRYDALVDFASVAENLDLLDKDQKPERFLALEADCSREILGWDTPSKASTLAEMTNFLVGERQLWGDFADGNHLKALNPENGWVEFKIRTHPQVRVYGAFVQLDHFVGVHACPRKNQPSEAFLENKWRQLWGYSAFRITGGDPRDALTNYSVAKE